MLVSNGLYLTLSTQLLGYSKLTLHLSDVSCPGIIQLTRVFVVRVGVTSIQITKTNKTELHESPDPIK